MRVALVSEHASPLAALGGVDAGGQNVHVAHLAAGLAARGCDVAVYTRRDDVASPRTVEVAQGYRVVHVDAGPPEPIAKDDLLPFMGRFGDELAVAWALDPPDVAHAHFWMSGLATLAAARRTSTPVAMTFHALGVVKRRHQGAMDTSPPSRLDAERHVLQCADQVVATCSDEVFELRRMGADRSRVTVVPCGVDTGVFTPAGPRRPRTPGRRRVLCVGRLVERKGVDDVVRALAHVPDAELVIAGGPDEAGLVADADARRLVATAVEAGVAERVRLLGRVGRDQLPALYRSADVVVCTPWYEPFGIVPLEAMACGVPVVASAVGGLTDTVVHGETGVHVPPRDVGAVAEALQELLADDAARAAMGAAATRRARQRYDWDRVVDGHLAAYATLRRHAVLEEVR